MIRTVLLHRTARNTILISCCLAAIGAASAVAQTKPAGVPVPEDSAVWTSFKQLEQQSAYRMTLNMEPSDPRMAQMMKQGMGMSPMEHIIKGGAHQVIMRWKMPAMDQPGTIDDWEIRAVVQNGRGARLISTPAAPRLLKFGEQQLMMQMQMANRQAAMAIAQAAVSGPMGWISASVEAASMALSDIEAARLMKEAKAFFTWKCMDQVGAQKVDRTTNPLFDLRPLGDQPVGSVSAAAYEFYVRSGNKLQGPVRLFVAKDSGLPLRIEMNDPQGRGSMYMDYSFDHINDIEIPACMANSQ